MSAAGWVTPAVSGGVLLRTPSNMQALLDAEGASDCGQTGPGRWAFLCSRGRDHVGRHIAEGDDGDGVREVCAAWPGEHEPRAADLGPQMGERVAGHVAGQPFVGTVTGSLVKDGVVVDVSVCTDEPLTTPAGRQVHGAILRGAAEMACLRPAPAALTAGASS